MTVVYLVKEFVIGFSMVVMCYSYLAAASITSRFNGLTLNPHEEVEGYSFLLGGHLYGAPENRHSVYPSASVLANIDLINSTNARFFVSLGDNYRATNNVNMSHYVDALARKLKMPLFNTVGNHDVTDRSLYEKHFGRTYYHFTFGSELFIFLDTEIDGGEVIGDQLKYFRNVINGITKESGISNVFVFSHKLIWSVNNPYFDIVYNHLNSRKGYSDSNNFQSNIVPILAKLSKGVSVYWVSGDVGCSWSYPLFCEKEREHDITYIATGVGDTGRDMILLVNVSKVGEVALVPFSLTGERVYPVGHYGVDYWRKQFGRQQPKTETGIIRWVKRVVIVIQNKYFWAGVFVSAIVWGGLFIGLRKLETDE